MKTRSYKALLVAAGMIPGLSAAQLPGLPVTGFSAGGTGLTPFYVMGFELGPWRDYLARELTPAYMVDPDLPPLHISWLDSEAVALLPAFAGDLFSEPTTWMRYELDIQRQDGFGNNASMLNVDAPGTGFERQLLSPGVFHQLNEQSLLGVEAIMAYQSYGTSLLGMQAISSPDTRFPAAQGFQPYQETGYGTGVRLNLSSAVASRFTVGAGFQSRIDMQEFANYRGVYSSPADFDSPARASVGLAFQANDKSSVNVSVERVMYSEVNAFPSRMLPDRFLSMLGDSTSPNFAWDDLTVYTLGYTWNNGEDTQLRAEVSSRSTPNPSSQALQSAIGNEIADHAMLVGYSRRTGESSRFNLNAAYAPADYMFGGNVLGVTSEDLGQDLEIEAFWTWDF